MRPKRKREPDKAAEDKVKEKQPKKKAKEKDKGKGKGKEKEKPSPEKATDKGGGARPAKRPRTGPAPYDTDFFGPLEGSPVYEERIQEIRNEKWAQLILRAKERGFSTNRHSFRYGTKGRRGSLDLAHTHGEWGNIVESEEGKARIEKSNISTKRTNEGRVLDHEALWGALPDSATGAHDALRVLKGTHLTKGLTTTNLDQAKAATELAVELGVSEGARGGQKALIHAANLLYLIKHGKFAATDFYNPAKGFVGSGSRKDKEGGGAERLRALTPESIYNRHSKQNFARFLEVQEDKTKEGRWSEFPDWLKHKWTKWGQRYK